MSEYPDIRWQQRFENFCKALALMDEAYAKPIESYDELSREGMIQRFEFTFELAWNLLKDYLEFSGVVIEPPVAPRNVIKKAFATDLIGDGQEWMDMMKLRNELSHNYNMDKFSGALIEIQKTHWPLLQSLRETLRAKLDA